MIIKFGYTYFIIITIGSSSSSSNGFIIVLKCVKLETFSTIIKPILITHIYNNKYKYIHNKYQ